MLLSTHSEAKEKVWVLGELQGESKIMVSLRGTSGFLGGIKPVSKEACAQVA